MLKLILLTLYCFCTVSSTAQTSFFKSYDFGTVEYVYQVIEYHDRIYINTATWCGSECSFLSEVDLDGNILWKTAIPDIDIAQGTMVIVNDTITITGNNDLDNSSFLMAHFTLNGEKIGETITINHPALMFTGMFQLTTQYFSNRYVICGTGKLMDNVHYSLMYFVNRKGNLDTLITLNQTNDKSAIWDSYVDSQGYLTVSLWLEKDEPGTNFRKIYKFNENIDTVWSYQTENSSPNLTVPRSCELHNGLTAIAYINPEGDPFLHSIRTIDPDGNLNWQYDYQWTGSRTRQIYRLKTLKNGDIMGSGQYSEFEQNPTIGDSPWLFRMSPEGELLWEHVYYEFDSTIPPNGSSRIGAIFDFVELENGDILAVGTTKYYDSDMLILRVNSNGCLLGENCSEANIITDTKEISPIQNQFIIYPTLATDEIRIEFGTKQHLLNFEIRDVTGVVRLNGTIIEGYGQAIVSDLQAGIYFICLRNGNQLTQVEKFVKI